MSPLNIPPGPMERPRLFYGWSSSSRFRHHLHGFGSAYAFVDSLQLNFGASGGSVSLVFSLAGCLCFSFGIFSGPLADRSGAATLWRLSPASAPILSRSR